ncbi:MAG: S8 family serine peptidase [Methanospirillum sp.]
MRYFLPVLLLVLALCLCLAPAAGAKAPLAKNGTPDGAALALSPELLGLADPSTLPANTSREGLIDRMQDEGQYRPAGATVRGVRARAPAELVNVYITLDSRAPLSTVDPYVWEVRSRDEPSRTVAAWVEVPRLLRLAAEPGVASVRPVWQPVAATGSTTAEADRLLLADRVRGELGLTGAGVKVGVISDGVAHWAGAAATGDLPGDLHVLRDSIGGDEGTAMLEIVHDIAPGAELYFHDWGENSIDFTQGVDALADAGCTVIVDDVSWIDEPFFLDGPVAEHIQAVAETRNVLYVSSAGNWAPNHYQGTYLDDGFGFHDFSGGASADSKYLYLQIPAGGSLRAVLEWDDPWSGSSNDYDLYLYDTADFSSPIAVSTGWQKGGTSTPLEIFSYQNTGSSTIEAEIDVSNYNGAAAARTLEVYLYPAGGTQVYGDNIVAADSVFGHSAAPAVVSVGAIDAADAGSDTIEWYSSRGPATIRFPAAVQRQKPDVAGIDGVRITGAGGLGGGRFYGTSAAAPAVAAVSALVWSGAPAGDAAGVRSALLSSAVDLGPAGPDTSFGNGRVDAVAFARAVGIGATDVSVTSIAPNTGTPGTTVAVTNLSGTGFRVGASVALLRAGATEIAATGVEVVSPTTITCRLALPAGAGPGPRDVLVTNPGGANATLIGGFTVAGLTPVPLPGGGAPRDLDGDGVYDDVNGNGRADFADVVLYFNQMTWIAENEPVSAFDFSVNGRIDFADVVALFNGL